MKTTEKTANVTAENVTISINELAEKVTNGTATVNEITMYIQALNAQAQAAKLKAAEALKTAKQVKLSAAEAIKAENEKKAAETAEHNRTAANELKLKVLNVLQNNTFETTIQLQKSIQACFTDMVKPEKIAGVKIAGATTNGHSEASELRAKLTEILTNEPAVYTRPELLTMLGGSKQAGDLLSNCKNSFRNPLAKLVKTDAIGRYYFAE